MSLRIRAEVTGDTTLFAAADEAVLIADTLGCEVAFFFNNRYVVVEPGDLSIDVANDFRNKFAEVDEAIDPETREGRRPPLDKRLPPPRGGGGGRPGGGRG